VQFLVESLKILYLALGHGGIPFAEVLGIVFLVLLLQLVHICLNVDTKDVISVLLWVEGTLIFALLNNLTLLTSGSLGLNDMVTSKSLVIVRNIKSTINCSLKSTEDSVSSGGSD